MKKTLTVVALLALFSCVDKREESPKEETATPISTDNKQVIVYTTADSSDYRLSATDTLQFTELTQPLETQICVFVDPTKTFQTYLGTGAALTDASAEVYAKLP